MKVALSNISLHVEVRGTGDLSLIFLHYWGGSSRTWKHVAAELATNFQTIAIDHRGWGRSEAPATGYSLSDLAMDAEGVIRALSLRRYILIGHSMGGKVAQLMASHRLIGLEGLVLVAPSPPTPMSLPVEARERMAGAYDSRLAIEETIDNVLTARPLPTEDREQVIEDSLKGAPAAKLAWPRTASQEDITAHVIKINVPTAIVVGELDKVDTPELLKTELLFRVPHADMHVLPDTGHLSMLESPEALVSLIRSFCASIPV